jgi:hypothetical protein
MPEQYYDLNDNQMPYGGATDIHGKILWKVSKEEHDQMMARIKKAFEKELWLCGEQPLMRISSSFPSAIRAKAQPSGI